MSSSVGVETLRRWHLAEGLWEQRRHRDPHRLDGSMAIRFGKRYLVYREVTATSGREEVDRPSEVSKKKLSTVWRTPADHPWRKRVVS